MTFSPAPVPDHETIGPRLTPEHRDALGRVAGAAIRSLAAYREEGRSSARGGAPARLKDGRATQT